MPSKNQLGGGILLVYALSKIPLALIGFLIAFLIIIGSLSRCHYEGMDTNYAAVPAAVDRTYNPAETAPKHGHWTFQEYQANPDKFVNEPTQDLVSPDLKSLYAWNVKTGECYLIRPESGSDPSFQTKNFVRLERVESEDMSRGEAINWLNENEGLPTVDFR